MLQNALELEYETEIAMDALRTFLMRLHYKELSAGERRRVAL